MISTALDAPFRLGHLVLVDDVMPASWVVNGARNFEYPSASSLAV